MKPSELHSSNAPIKVPQLPDIPFATGFTA